MPISHQSYIHKPNDYVAPVDLNLLGKVLQFKQGEFDAGVKQVQGHIDTLAALDVVKDSDRQYLNAKISNLVHSTNSIGGADYSDPNVSNQIASLSSQIYGDDKVINAVANTKKFRYVQKHYQDLKEKKPKDWNPANEWYDMNKFAGWLNDGQVGTSAEEGAGKITPKVDYEADWQKMFDKIAQSANIRTEMTDKGLMYRIDGIKEVSPERIWETASKMLTPAQRQQLAIEGRYTYNPLPMSELAKAYDEKVYKQVGEATAQLKDYKARYKGATGIQDQEKYEKLIQEKEGEITKLLAPVQKNADQLKESLYLNEKLKGLQARYAFTQATSKLQANAGKMFELKYNMDAAKFNYQQHKDATDQQIELAKEGLAWSTDPLTGQKTIVRDHSLPGRAKKDADGNDVYSGLPGLDNAGQGQEKEFTQEKLIDRKTTIVDGNKQLFKDFVQQLGRKKGLTDVLISDLMDDGRIQTKVDPEMEKAAKGMMDTWQAMTRGEKINYATLDPLFKSFAGKYQENQKEIEAIDRFQATIDKQVRDEFGITNEEYYVGKQYEATKEKLKELDKQYPLSVNMGGATRYKQNEYEAKRKPLEDKLNALKPIVNNDRYKAYTEGAADKTKALIASANAKFNLPTLTMSDDKPKNVAKMISGNAGTLQWFKEDGSVGKKESLNPDNVDVISKGYAYVQTDSGKAQRPVITFKYKTGTGADDFEIRKVPLTEEQALMMGFGSELKDLKGYRLGLHMNGEVNAVNTTSGKSYDIKYDIVKYHPENQNDESVFVRVQKGNNKISLYNLPFASPEQAIQYMESQTKYKTIDEAMENLSKVSE